VFVVTLIGIVLLHDEGRQQDYRYWDIKDGITASGPYRVSAAEM